MCDPFSPPCFLPTVAECRLKPLSLECASVVMQESQTVLLATQADGCANHTAPLFLCLCENGEILLANRFFWLITLQMDVSLFFFLN